MGNLFNVINCKYMAKEIRGGFQPQEQDRTEELKKREGLCQALKSAGLKTPDEISIHVLDELTHSKVGAIFNNLEQDFLSCDMHNEEPTQLMIDQLNTLGFMRALLGLEEKTGGAIEAYNNPEKATALLSRIEAVKETDKNGTNLGDLKLDGTPHYDSIYIFSDQVVKKGGAKDVPGQFDFSYLSQYVSELIQKYGEKFVVDKIKNYERES